MFPGRCIYYMPEQSQKAYWADQWDQRDLDRQIRNAKKKAWWPDLCRHVETLDNESLILEAGCGMGQFVYHLHEAGRHVVGVDIVEETLQRTKQFHPQLDLRAQDVRHLDFPDASAALYISLGVIEHFPEGPDDVLREAARVLRDDGILFLTVPYYNLYRRLREPWWRIKYGVRNRPFWSTRLGRRKLVFYQYAYGSSELEAILERHGFEPRETLKHHSRVALTKDSWIGKRLSPRWRNRLARSLDRISPGLMSHMVLLVARRRPRGAQAGAGG